MAKLALILVFILPLKSIASSCCGQSPTSFTVLSLQQKLSLSTAVSLTDSVGRVFNDSKEFYVWNDKERKVQNLKLDIATSLNSSSQVFLSSSYSIGTYQSSGAQSSAYNFSDILLGYNHEVVPEYSFSYWKPVVYLTALVNLPTGNSIYDKNSLGEGAGVTGHNQTGYGFGVTLKKVYYPLTLTLQAKVLELLKTEILSTRVSGFYDSSISLLSSYSAFEYIAHLGLSFNHLSSREVNGYNSGSAQKSTLMIGLQRPLNDSIHVGISYADQTLIGNAKNTLLNRTYSINLNYNYF